MSSERKKTKAVGAWGEEVAARLLASQGYAILERNWQMGHYEVDIIAMKDDYIVFVEVKTRTSDDYDPVEAVDSRKRRRITISADVYLRTYDFPHQFRFDIVSITGTEANHTVEHITDAYLPTLKSYR